MLITWTNCVTKANFCFNTGFDVLSFTSGNKMSWLNIKKKDPSKTLAPSQRIWSTGLLFEKALRNQGHYRECWETCTIREATKSSLNCRVIRKLSYLLILSFSDCDKALFQNTIQLREKWLDIKEALIREKKVASKLRKEYDVLVKKVL